MKSFNKNYSFNINDSSDLFVTERNMLEYVMGIDKTLMNEIFEGMGTGYDGNRIEKAGNKYELKGTERNRLTDCL